MRVVDNNVMIMNPDLNAGRGVGVVIALTRKGEARKGSTASVLPERPWANRTAISVVL